MAPLRPERRLLPDLPAALAVLWAIVAGSLGCVLSARPAHGQRLSAPVTVTTGDRPAALLAADFTGRGQPELLALHAGPTPLASSLRVLNNSRGTFSLGSELALAGFAMLVMPRRPGMLPDLFWTSVSSQEVTLMRAAAQPGGSYLPGYALSTFPVSGSAPPKLLLAAGGRHTGLENAILVADAANNQLYTVVPNADGAYAVQPGYSSPSLPLTAGATQLLTADLNGDGTPDLVVAGATGVQVFLAHGDATQGDGTSFTGFAPSSTYPCAGTVRSIALADMDGDAHADLLVEGADGRIDIYHGNADGTFAAVSEVGTGVESAATGRGGHLIGVADLNGDGVPDLVLANPKGITVLLGTGARNFQLSAMYPLAPTPNHFVFTDLNGDGKPDIAFDSPQGVTILYAQSSASGQLTATPEPSAYGADFILTLQLTASAAAATPTGTVDFSIDGTLVGSGTLSGGGQASYTVTAPMETVGQHTLTAAYSGDATYSPASFTGTHTVQGLPTVSTIGSLVTPIYYGQEIGYTNGIDAVVSVEPANAGAQPAGATLSGGLIYIYLDGQLVCSLLQGAVSPTGGPQRCNDANFMGYQAGSHTMVAAYQGNDFYAPSTSLTYTVVILPDDTSTVFTTSLSPAPYGTAVTFTATLSALYATPTGPVVFFDGATSIGTAILDASGIATFTSSNLAVGSHALTARYAATRNFNASQSSLTQVILAVSGSTLTSSLNPSALGQPVTFAATIAVNGVAGPVTGSVLFTDNGMPLGTVPLNAQGTATYTTSTLALGPHAIVATFSPGSSLVLSSNAALTQVVIAAATISGNFTLTVSPADIAVGVGNSGTVTATVTEVSGFNEPVTLSCAGLPWESTCTFLTATLPAGGGSTLLAIHPEAPHNCSDSQQYFIAGSGGWPALGLGSVAALLLGLRRRGLRAALFASVLCLLPMLSGCGLGGHCTDLGTRPGSYNFTVIGTSAVTSVVHSQSVHMKAFLDGE